MLARDLMLQAPRDVELVPRSKRETDVTSEEDLTAAVRDARPHVVINCAAFANVDAAESQQSLAFAVNGEGPGLVGQAVARSGGRMLVVHFSTDYVFDGQSRRPYREDDATQALGAYGASKLAGEASLAASGAPHLIIRTQWLFGLGGRSFPRTMWERARGGQVTRVVEDQVGRPTYTVDLALATWRLVGNEPSATSGSGGAGGALGRGILHVANGGATTWYDVAKRVFEAAGRLDLLAPCSTDAYPTPARRPAYSVLDTSRYESLAKATMPAWQNALDRMLSDLRMERAL
jgi:dTDP-4-dehydrorhamnose reductase